MPSTQTYIELLERLRSVHLHVDARRCLAVRNRSITCNRCASACPSGCITVATRRPADEAYKPDGAKPAESGKPAEAATLAIDPERCIGCGTCAAACPTGAIAPRKPDDRSAPLTTPIGAHSCARRAMPPTTPRTWPSIAHSNTQAIHSEPAAPSWKPARFRAFCPRDGRYCSMRSSGWGSPTT